MDIYGLTKVDGNSQFGMWVTDSNGALRLAKLCPTTIDRLQLWRQGRRIARLLAPVVIGKLDNTEGQLRLLP